MLYKFTSLVINIKLTYKQNLHNSEGDQSDKRTAERNPTDLLDDKILE